MSSKKPLLRPRRSRRRAMPARCRRPARPLQQCVGKRQNEDYSKSAYVRSKSRRSAYSRICPITAVPSIRTSNGRGTGLGSLAISASFISVELAAKYRISVTYRRYAKPSQRLLAASFATSCRKRAAQLGFVAFTTLSPPLALIRQIRREPVAI